MDTARAQTANREPNGAADDVTNGDDALTASSSAASAPRFEQTYIVSPDDIDRMGHVNNVVYLRWVQDVAVAHWLARATPEQIDAVLWVVVRHEIDYLRPALPGETVTARTWVGAATRATYERFTEIERAGGEMLARARTVWCPVDSRTKRPRRVDAELRRRFERES